MMKRFTRTSFQKKYGPQLNEDETLHHIKNGVDNVSGEQVRGFTRTKENFICDHCGEHVTGTGYTNHCPNCLWSKHVDENPGDRASLCRGAMTPISVSVSAGAYRILHRCTQCGFTRPQDATQHDNMERLIELSAEPFVE